MVCSAHNRVVMERSADIDELVELPAATKPAAFGSQYRKQIDIAIALAPRLPDIALAGATRAHLRVGYTYVRRYVARLTAGFFLNRVMLSEADPDLSERDPHRHVRHEVNQLLDLVEMAGAKDRVFDLRLNVTGEDRNAIAYLPSSPIVLHLGMRWFQTGSTLDSTIALIREMRRFGVPLVVTYAPECEQFVQKILESREADVLLGGLPFYRWAAVFERARVVVTVDTGATHVASAMRRPTVVAFEHRYFRLNSQEWAPYGVPSVLVQKPPGESASSLARFRSEILDGVASLIENA